MIRFGFFLMTKKGFEVIKAFVGAHGGAAVSYVVGSPDVSVKQDWFAELGEFCAAHEIRFVERAHYQYCDLEEDYKVAVGWRWLIDGASNLIVLHDSLLPKYRGFAPIVNMLINGEPSLGVTAIFASSEYDKGDVIAQRSIPITYPLKIAAAIDTIAPVYSDIVLGVYSDLCRGPLHANAQDESAATYSPWLDARDYFIDWHWPADKIVRFIDAVGSPYDGAKALLSGQIVSFIEAAEVVDVCVENRNRHIGKVIFLSDGAPVIVCGAGLLKAVDTRDEAGAAVKINFRSRFE